MANNQNTEIREVTESESHKGITRRQFLGRAVLAVSSLAVLGFGLAGCDDEDERRRRRDEDDRRRRRDRDHGGGYGGYPGDGDRDDRDRDDRGRDDGNRGRGSRDDDDR